MLLLSVVSSPALAPSHLVAVISIVGGESSSISWLSSSSSCLFCRCWWCGKRGSEEWRSFDRMMRTFSDSSWVVEVVVLGEENLVSNFFAWDGNQLLQLWTDQINNILINSFVSCKQSLDLWKLNLVFNIYFKTKLNKSQSLNLFTISWKNYVIYNSRSKIFEYWLNLFDFLQ